MSLTTIFFSRRAWAAALLLAANSLAQSAPLQKLLPAGSEITFVSRQMGVPVEGQFRKFDAQISLDPAKPEAGKVSLTVDTGSATLGVRETDAELPKPTWFSVARFPQASFESSAIRATGQGRYEVRGRLTIKGQTQELLVPVTLAQTGSQWTASGQFAIKRLAFKIGENEWADTSMVADEVQVRFKLALASAAQ